MTELSDTALYEEGVKHMHDYSLLYWYARMDWKTRHRLLAIANEKDVKEGLSPIFDENTLSMVLFRLITSPFYKREVLIAENGLVNKMKNMSKEFAENVI